MSDATLIIIGAFAALICSLTPLVLTKAHARRALAQRDYRRTIQEIGLQ